MRLALATAYQTHTPLNCAPASSTHNFANSIHEHGCTRNRVCCAFVYARTDVLHHALANTCKCSRERTGCHMWAHTRVCSVFKKICPQYLVLISEICPHCSHSPKTTTPALEAPQFRTIHPLTPLEPKLFTRPHLETFNFWCVYLYLWF